MTLNELRDLIKNDLEIIKLGLNVDELSDLDVLTISQYFELRGTIVDGFKHVLKIKPYIEVVYKATELQAEVMRKERFKKSLEVFASHVYLQDASLDQFSLETLERKKLFDAANHFIENYSKGNDTKGFYIHGKFGTGKSYLTSAVAHELSKKGFNVLFVFMPELVRTVKVGISQNDLDYRISILRNCDVLILDDIGGENTSAWFRDEILLTILQYRLNAKLPVIFSSNLDLKQLFNKFESTRQGTDSTSSMRLIQRIRDLSTYYELTEKTYSQLKVSGGK